jgi:hypothetical protein
VGGRGHWRSWSHYGARRSLAVCMPPSWGSPLSPRRALFHAFRQYRALYTKPARRLITLFAAGELSYPGEKRSGEPTRPTANAAALDGESAQEQERQRQGDSRGRGART